MKEMFDRCYYPCLGQLEGRPYATILCAGSDGGNSQRQLDRIATGWRLRRVADRVIVNTAAQTPEAILAPKSIAPDRLAEATWAPRWRRESSPGFFEEGHLLRSFGVGSGRCRSSPFGGGGPAKHGGGAREVFPVLYT